MKIKPNEEDDHMSKGINLQDTLLNRVRRDKTAITVFLVNGFQLSGVVAGFDNFTVILDSAGKQQLIYKHAISTIVPAKPVSLLDSEEKEN